MHRLLKLSGTPLHNYPGISVSKFSENWNRNMTENTCLLCKRSNISGSQARLQSTNVNPNLVSKKPRKRRKTKKSYVELLVVRPNSTSQQKATIQKLTSSDLKLLAGTNLNLSELYKLKEFSKTPVSTSEEHTYNNLNIIGNIPDTNSESKIEFMNLNIETSSEKIVLCEIPSLTPPKVAISSVNNILPMVEEVVENEEDEFEHSEHKGSLHPAVVEEHIPDVVEVKEDAKLATSKEIKTKNDKRYWEEITTRTLASYIEVCCALRNPQRGFNALAFYRGRAKKNNMHYPVVNNVKVYNALLKGFAHKGDFSKIQEVLHIMKEEQVELNVNSYVAIFECLGRVNVKDNHLREIRRYGRDALLKGISFDQMMNEGSFLNDEREIILKSMRAYDPGYTPEYEKPVVWYNNHLLNHLNHDAQKDINEIEYKSNIQLFTPEKLKECVKKQIELEKGGYVIVDSIESRGPVSEEAQRHRKTLEEHYKMWEEAALQGFNRDLSTLSAQRSSTNMEPYLRSIPVKDIVAIIVDEAKRIAQGSETYSPTVKMLYKDLGNKVYARYRVLRKQKTGVLDKIIDIHNEYCNQYAALHPKLDVLPDKECKINPRQIWQWTEYKLKDQGATIDMDHQEWVPTTLQFIGKFLYHIVMHDLKIDVNSLRNSQHKNYLPAFYTIFRSQTRLVKEEVKPHPILSKLYRNSLPETLTFPTYELPMLCPPVPWTSVVIGGYLVSPCEVIRLPYQATTQRQRLSEAGSQKMYPSLDALNQLAAVPWKVNQRILDVVLEVFNNGGSSSLDVPEPPSSLSPPPQACNEMDKAERYQLFKQKMQYRRKKAEMYSLWCDCLYRLSLANHFRDDVFWLPHNMDFRGRVYPVPPHLNHLGSDLARSMLVFAEPRPLGPEGLDWLKIHLVNLTGLKKRDSISERLAYANQIMHLIFDSADRPLTGKRWWAESDEPWQTLACCMEIAEVVRSPDPEGYMSHFPIHQDGSCNGLQHYAALGRDTSGAFSVNLASSDVPQDVYSAVVALVEEQRAKDAENGDEIAKVLSGFVKRKVIKQTIMTTVYGVTRFGARLQIAKQLKDIDDFPKEAVWAASSYLTSRTFDSLRTMFTSTREIQDWFTECARLISAVSGRHVEWVTPLGLPIVQPYFKAKKNVPQEGFAMDKYEKPNVMKQKNAFPPNFIHSLDSSHMMLTSLHCERAGITFVSVHDCYWTHPSTVHIMNKICREQFVALHSEPILDNLSNFLAEKYSYNQGDLAGDGSVADLTKKKLNRILRQLPKTGNFDINQVLKSVYFFS